MQPADVVSVSRAPLAWLSPWSMGSPAGVVKLGSIDQGERVEVPAGIDQLADVQPAAVFPAPIGSRPCRAVVEPPVPKRAKCS